MPDPANPGYSKQVSKLEALRLALGQQQLSSGPLSTTAPPATSSVAAPDIEGGGGPLSQKNIRPTDLVEASRYDEAKLDAANTQKGVLPFQDDTVVVAAPPVAVAPPVVKAPPVVAAPPAAAAVPKGRNIYPRADPRWAAEEARLAQEAATVAENIRKEKEIARQKDEDIRRNRQTEEGKLEVKKADEEQTALSSRASDGAEMVPYAKRIASSVETISKTSPEILGMLNQAKISSAILRFVDEGISAGTIGTLTIPGLKNLVLQLNPAIVKDQRSDGSNPTLEAYQALITDAARLSLAYARIVNKGMGSMSNYERQIIKDAVGTDPYRTGKKGLLSAAKVVECEAANAAEQQELWSRMKKAGKTWSEYKDSTYLAELKKTQEKRTAAAMGVKQ